MKKKNWVPQLLNNLCQNYAESDWELWQKHYHHTSEVICADTESIHIPTLILIQQLPAEDR